MMDGHTTLHAFLRYLHERRPFEDYIDQPDTADRTRLAVQSLPLALPEKKTPSIRY